jgi:hypothetical protein
MTDDQRLAKITYKYEQSEAREYGLLCQLFEELLDDEERGVIQSAVIHLRGHGDVLGLHLADGLHKLLEKRTPYWERSTGPTSGT